MEVQQSDCELFGLSTLEIIKFCHELNNAAIFTLNVKFRHNIHQEIAAILFYYKSMFLKLW